MKMLEEVKATNIMPDLTPIMHYMSWIPILSGNHLTFEQIPVVSTLNS